MNPVLDGPPYNAAPRVRHDAGLGAVPAHPPRVDQGNSKIEALPPSLIIRGWICSGGKTQIIGSQSQDSLLNPS
jgi:hypothetical protein